MRARFGQLVAIASVVLAAGCVRHTTIRQVNPSGTCAGACDRYMSCKRSKDDALRSACERECVAAYSTDGVEDTETLGYLEQLDCEATVGLVEGESGREPRTRPRDPQATRPKPR